MEVEAIFIGRSFMFGWKEQKMRICRNERHSLDTTRFLLESRITSYLPAEHGDANGFEFSRGRIAARLGCTDPPLKPLLHIWSDPEPRHQDHPDLGLSRFPSRCCGVLLAAV